MIVAARRISARISIAGCLTLAPFTVATAPVAAENSLPSVAIADFSYKDTSGETRDQAQEHSARLNMFRQLIRDSLASGGKFTSVELECPNAECAVEDGIAPAPLVEAASKIGARYLVTGGVQKLSTLIQKARLTVLDLKKRKLVLDRLYSFRGDTDDAWRQAAIFASRYVSEIPPGD